MFQSQSSGPHRKVLRTLLVHSKDAILQMCFFQLRHIMAILDHEVDVDLGIVQEAKACYPLDLLRCNGDLFFTFIYRFLSLMVG